MADSSNSTLAPNANPNEFDPVEWLARFKAVSGWWLIGADDKLTVGWHLMDSPSDQAMQAREIYREIEKDPARRAAVQESILAGHPLHPVHPQVRAILEPLERGQLTAADAWEALVVRLREVEDPAVEATDETIELAGDLATALMAMPAPNAAALCWKLDYLLAVGLGDSTGSYSADFVRQTVDDYRRMLGGE